MQSRANFHESLIGTKLSKASDGFTADPTYFKSIVGSSRYLTYTRIDITYGAGLVCKFIEAPKHSYLQVARRILQYMKGTLNHGLFHSNIANNLIGYSDSD